MTTEQRGRHWSEIERSEPRSLPLPGPLGPPPPTGGKQAGARNRRLVLIAGLGVLAIGLMAFFAIYHARTSQVSAGPSVELIAREIEADRQDRQKARASAEDAVTERVQEWTALLQTILATGEDKTDELVTFIEGSPEEVAQTAAAYQKEWSAAQDGKVGVVPGTARVEKIVLRDADGLAGVLMAMQLQLSSGARVRCVESTAWALRGKLWCRATWTATYWCGGKGKFPFGQGTQVDGMVWAPVRVQEIPRDEAAKAGTTMISVTFVVENLGREPTTPSDYAVRVYGANGSAHDVSARTEALLPATYQLQHSFLLDEEKTRFALAFEVPVDTDLMTLAFDVVRVSTTVSSDADAPAYAKPGTPRAWALAASAVLARYNGMANDILGGAPPAAVDLDAWKTMLEKSWDVRNRDDLLAVLAWLDQEGHRQVWDEGAAYLAALSDDQLQELLSSVARDPEAKHRVDLILKYAATLGPKSIKGFDYTRYICLCRWGYLCGYFSAGEAWARIMPVAAKLQATFASWAELGQNYLIGREYWSYAETQESGDAMRSVYEDLLASPSSPWLANDWSMDLGVGPAGTF